MLGLRAVTKAMQPLQVSNNTELSSLLGAAGEGGAQRVPQKLPSTAVLRTLAHTIHTQPHGTNKAIQQNLGPDCIWHV